MRGGIVLHEEFEKETADPHAPLGLKNYYVRQVELIQQSRIRNLFVLERWYAKFPRVRLVIRIIFAASALLFGIFSTYLLFGKPNVSLISGFLISSLLVAASGAIIIRRIGKHWPALKAIQEVGDKLRKELAFQWIYDRYKICVNDNEATYQALFNNQYNTVIVETEDNKFIVSKYVVDKGYIICQDNDHEFELQIDVTTLITDLS